jgi:diguanylate cyclase (GGDEF)-like protein
MWLAYQYAVRRTVAECAPESDRRKGRMDRRAARRRNSDSWTGSVRFAGWNEQLVQFLTRYLFVALAMVFFGSAESASRMGMERWQMYAFFFSHGLINTLMMWHAWRNPRSIMRYRIAMWLDIVAVSVGVLNDPYDIPPTLIVYILVVLGNGMRYGMPFFAEGLVGSFVGGLTALGIRQLNSTLTMAPGMIFLTLFSGIVLIYAYILMGRIESSRRQLEHTSATDTLTGLLNRRGLYEIAVRLFDRALGHGEKLIVMFADMDKFKSINDTFGHPVGDQVLRELGTIFRESLRANDIASRYGGDEFVLILSNTTMDEAEFVARRIQEKVKGTAQSRGHDISVTIAFGEAPTHGASLDAVLETVDQALYQSKEKHGAGGVMRAGQLESA